MNLFFRNFIGIGESAITKIKKFWKISPDAKTLRMILEVARHGIRISKFVYGVLIVELRVTE